MRHEMDERKDKAENPKGIHFAAFKLVVGGKQYGMLTHYEPRQKKEHVGYLFEAVNDQVAGKENIFLLYDGTDKIEANKAIEGLTPIGSMPAPKKEEPKEKYGFDAAGNWVKQ